MSDNQSHIVAIIGGGLAGCECAWRLAGMGLDVQLFEMRPEKSTPAHVSGDLAELVCSNSLRSSERTKAVGVLKDEMASLGSLVMQAAAATRLPAGKAFAVDRDRFAAYMTDRIESHPRITVQRREVASLDAPALEGAWRTVVAAGPLASDPLARSLHARVGRDHLSFYDAIAPIVDGASVDMDHAFFGSRYRPEDTDYLNCPLAEDEYKALVRELVHGEKVVPREFEKQVHFEGCLPVEEMARRGEMTLAFGPLKPVGLEDPRTGKRPFAVVQLRAENEEKTAFNLVGFQTKLTWGEQKRVFRMIPGLRNAEFLRLGSIHRNTYVDAPRVLGETLELKAAPGIHLAGQITGVEGYVESAACGQWLGLALGLAARGKAPARPPVTTAMGALLANLGREEKNFQPSNAHFGLMPALEQKAGKRRRKELYGERAGERWAEWLAGLDKADVELDIPEGA
ncbi:MAG: methylenetetrahydrofolate--tRNA-(uracil(54)-C(5))-methyltransferase (FADH(2)-oxidizing) TrmFO [Desulfovibrionaceae bacterium]